MSGHLRRAPRTSEQGFTLIELLVVLALISAVTLLALPLAQTAMRGGALRLATASLLAAARSTRADALRAGAPRSLMLDTAVGRYWADGLTPSALPAGIRAEARVPASEALSGSVYRWRFFADGGSSGGEIILRERGATSVVTVDWLTGGARVGSLR